MSSNDEIGRFRGLLRKLRAAANSGLRDLRGRWESLPWYPHPAAWLTLRKELRQRPLTTKELLQLSRTQFGTAQLDSEIIGLIELLRARKPERCVEIGLKMGGNTFFISQAVESCQRMVAVDIHLNNVAKLKFLSRSGQRLSFIQAPSQNPRTVERVKRALGGAAIDFIFIDGDHSYRGVSEDFIAYYPLVRPGGMIVFHDIQPDEFALTGKRSLGNTTYGGGVFLLWSILRDRFGHVEFVDAPTQQAYGIGVIFKPEDGLETADLEPVFVERLRQTSGP